MSVLVFVLVAAFVLLGVFAVVNWGVFTAPITLSLVVTQIDAPLGLVMLVAALVLAVVNLAFAASWRTSMLMESRRLSRELQAQRELAERAEASRVAELRKDLERALAELRGAIEDATRGTSVRIDTLDDALREAVREAVGNLSSSLGEIEDKLDRALGRSGTGP